MIINVQEAGKERASAVQVCRREDSAVECPLALLREEHHTCHACCGHYPRPGALGESSSIDAS